MKKLFSRQFLLNFLFLPVFALGSFYDSRLGNDNFNVTILFSFLFFLSFIFFFKKKSESKISSILIWLFIFISVSNIINWGIWGINDFEDYSTNKYFVLSCITFPVCFLVSKFKSEEDFSVFFKQISLIGLLLALLGAIQVILSGGGETRLAVFGGGPIVFSRWIGLFVIILTFNFQLNKLIKIPIILLSVSVMILSGSRGPLLFLVVAFLILQIKDKKITGILILTFLIVRSQLDSLILFLSKTPMLVRLFGLESSSSIKNGSSSMARFSLLDDCLISIKSNLFGYGMGNFSVYSDFSRVLGPQGYPHNFFFEIWVELGTIILVISLIIVTKIIFNIYSSIYTRGAELTKNKKTIICIWLFYFLNALVSGDLSDSRFLIVFTTIFYTYLVIEKRKNENTLPSPVL